MTERNSRLRAVEAEDITRTTIKWFGIEASNGQVVPGAAVFDIPVAVPTHPQITQFDYVNLSPLDDTHGKDMSTSLQVLFNDGIIDGSKTLLSMHLRKITGEQWFLDSKTESIMRLASVGVDNGKRMLLVEGHGGGAYEWRIGSNETGIDVGMNDLLQNFGSILHTVHPEVPESLSERYNVIALGACNKAGVDIPHKTIDSVGVPIVFTTDTASISVNPAHTRFAFPGNFIYSDLDPLHPKVRPVRTTVDRLLQNDKSSVSKNKVVPSGTLYSAMPDMSEEAEPEIGIGYTIEEAEASLLDDSNLVYKKKSK